mmetsp:Transcript_4479/g.8597  ORF Transcript_4479/g.8597 Transcript_4479/m.8597 type:complete len:714 (-) Transcript_4479:392-2533(-)
MNTDTMEVDSIVPPSGNSNEDEEESREESIQFNVPSSPSPPSTTAAIDADEDDETASTAHRRSRSSMSTSSSKASKIAFLLFVIATSLGLLHHSHPTSLSAIQKRYTSTAKIGESLLSAAMSNNNHRLLQVQHAMEQASEATGDVAASLKSTSLESLARMEEAFHSLRHHNNADDQRRSNNGHAVAGRALLDGLENAFHRGRSAPDRGGSATTTEEGGTNENDETRNLRKKGGRNRKHQQQQQQQRKLKKETRERRDLTDTTERGEEEGHPNSKLAAPLLAFGIIVLLVATLLILPSSERRRLDYLARNAIVLDENEAEIVEFYERAECGMQTIPFLQDEAYDDDNESFSGRRFPKRHSERDLRENIPSTRQNYLRSASDPSLVRHHHHHHHPNRRESHQGDMYYSRVLDTLHCEEEKEGDIIEDLMGCERMEDGREEHCSSADLMVQYNMAGNAAALSPSPRSSPSIGDMAENVAALSPSPDSPLVLVIGDGVNTKYVESGQAEIQEEVPSSQCSQSPPSFDSLTCDLEASTGETSHQDDDATDSTKVDIGAAVASSSPSMCSPTKERTPRGNQSSSSSRSNYSTVVITTTRLTTTDLYHHEENNNIPQRRRVSFSPKVEVRKLLPIDFEEEYSPRSMEMHHQEPTLFIRSYYYYYMTLAVAAAIVVSSFVYHTELLSTLYSRSSPMMVTLRGVDVFHRAESMLRSQWNAEL